MSIGTTDEPCPAQTRVYVRGVGATRVVARSGVEPTALAAEAIEAALTDAGLTVGQIDGIVVHPTGVSVTDLQFLGLSGLRFSAKADVGGASAVASLQLAQAAISAGLADNVVVLMARNGSSGARIDSRARDLLPGPEFRERLEHPIGLTLPVQWYAMVCRWHMAEHGTTREDLAEVALLARRNAQRNPYAQMQGRPLDLDGYLAGRPIADPYLLYDCCLESDVGCAVIVSGERRRSGGRAITLLGAEVARPSFADDWANRPDILEIGLTHAAPRLFERLRVRPGDLDLAMIYDCFTFEFLHQLEELGVCERGASGEFVRSGAASLTGKLPCNTHGGLLSEGHTGGFGHIIEAVRQLRGEAGNRQVNATLAAVTSFGNFGDGAVALLTNGEV